MKILRDTCAILFLSVGGDKVRKSTRALIEEARTISVSAISIGELACLQERRRIELPCHWKPWFRMAVEENGWQVLPISPEIAEEAYSLPGEFHADPADRFLVATARGEKRILLTTDRKLLVPPCHREMVNVLPESPHFI